MANTYSQIYIHIVFAPWNRVNMIPVKHKEEIQKYITGIIQNRKHKLLAINCMRDHIHILIGYNPLQKLPDLVRDTKASSSKFINERRWFQGKFQWQEGYGEFSCGHNQIDPLIKYINNQEEHHKKITFKEEYISLLEQNCISYNLDYLFDFY